MNILKLILKGEEIKIDFFGCFESNGDIDVV